MESCVCVLRRCFLCIFGQSCVVQTPQGCEYEGRSYKGKGVSDAPLSPASLVSFQSSVSAGGGTHSTRHHCLVSADHGCVRAAGGGDDGARPEGRVQGRPHRQDPHPDQPGLGRTRGRREFALLCRIPLKSNIQIKT